MWRKIIVMNIGIHYWFITCNTPLLRRITDKEDKNALATPVNNTCKCKKTVIWVQILKMKI